jgi:hypothetical protein
LLTGDSFLSNGIDPNKINVILSGEGNNPTFIPLSAGTTPLPAALPLFAIGLGALGLLGWRRKRKVQATA